MKSFVDETFITVISGKGGDGAVSFRREKYIPRGGPDGGDGGKGGDVVFIVRSNLKTLAHLKLKKVFKAENGKPGGKKKMHGRDGKNVVIEVPPGTVIRDGETGEVLKELLKEKEEWICLRGGRGGKGNVHFANSVRQAPRFAQPGQPGVSKKLIIELKIIADVGLVGLPNSGKSTLLSVLTNATPEVGSYPFTTKIPNLGVLRTVTGDIVIADIPGIIEGASSGAGLGLQFLKHIARTRVLLFLIDLTDKDPLGNFKIVTAEISKYSKELINRKRIIVGTKLDMPGTEERLEYLRNELGDSEVVGISSITMRGIEELKKKIGEVLQREGLLG